MALKHAKTVTVPSMTQLALNEQIALGNYPPDTTIADIFLSEDVNAAHVIDAGGIQFHDATVQTTAAVPPAIGSAVTGATEGSVLFAGVSGALQQDNAKLFWDNTNNSLGVGASPDPNTVLDLNSSTQAFRIPRLSNTAMYTIPATTGMMCYNTDNGSYWAYSPGFGFGWQAIYAPFTKPLFFQDTTCAFQQRGALSNFIVYLSSPTGSSIGADQMVELPRYSGVLALAPSTYTVATLPTGYQDRREFVSDALAPALGSAVVGGGAVRVPVNYDGTTWRVG